MPKLLLELATGLRQVGTGNGFELYGSVFRKIEPPKDNDAFHMGNDISGLGGKGTFKDFGQTCRFLEFLEQTRKHFLFYIGTAFPLDDSVCAGACPSGGRGLHGAPRGQQGFFGKL